MTRCSKLQKNYFSFEELPLWKRAVLLSICFLVIISFILPFTYTSHAETVEMITDQNKINEFNQILDGTYTGGKGVYARFVAQQIAQVLTGHEFTDMVRDWLIIDFSVGDGSADESLSGGHFGNVYSAIASTTILDISRTIGIGLLLLYFFLAMIDRATSDNFTVEVGIKLLLKLVAGYMLMDILVPDENGNGLVVEIFNLFSASFDTFDTPSTTLSKKVYDEVMDAAYSDWLTATVHLIRIAAPALCRWIMKIACLGTAIARIFEAVLLVIFSPIGVANVFNSSSSGNSSAVRYLKKIGVIALQGAIISGSLFIIEAMLYWNNTWNIFVNLATLFAGTSFISKSKSIANEIINP